MPEGSVTWAGHSVREPNFLKPETASQTVRFHFPTKIPHAALWHLSLIGCDCYRLLFGPEPLGGRLSSVGSYFYHAARVVTIKLTVGN